MSNGSTPGLRAALHADFQRAHRSEGPLHYRDFLLLAWRNPGLQALAAYRLTRWCASLHPHPARRALALLLGPASRLASAFVRRAYDITLEQDADIAPGFYIGHLGGILVGRCRIGSGSSIGQQVKIGPLGMTGQCPPFTMIGSQVWIGAHVRVLAGVRIGDGATIGAGSLVTRDVPDRCLVLGVPGRVARRNFDNGGML